MVTSLSRLPLFRQKRFSRGVSLIEVLISIVLIAVALLGVAGLQSMALKVNKLGQLREHSVMAVNNILERMEANNEAIVAGNYVMAALPMGAGTACDAGVFCDPGTLAAYDLFAFRTQLVNTLPGVTATISKVGTGPWTYTITVNWVERIVKASQSVATSGTVENFSYAVSRTYYNKALTIY